MMKRRFLVVLGVVLSTLMFAMPVMASAAPPTQAKSSDKADVNIDNDLTKPIAQNDIQYSINKNLNETQIRERFAEINSKYALYQPFSAEDTEFVRAYAKPANPVNESNISPMDTTKSWPFSKSDTSHYVKASFSGTIFSTIGTYITNSFGGNITATITAGITQWQGTELHIINTAYGIIGSGGVGIIYNGDLSGSTTSSSTFNLNRSQTYSGLVAYTNTNAYAIIKTSTGNFDIWAV